MMKLVFVVLLSGSPLLATQVFNVGLRIGLEYTDFDHHCRLSALVEPYRLSAELKAGKVVRAKLTLPSRFLPPVTYELNGLELERLEILEESTMVWIKQLYASPALLKQLLYTGRGFGSDACLPPRGVSSLPEEGVVFDFGVDSVGYLLPHMIHSQEVNLEGNTESLRPYRILLRLTQDRR
ncbi:hypothetical protein EBQ90_08090 [bacterium]|nr:hypothetical protein [bacterium]